MLCRAEFSVDGTYCTPDRMVVRKDFLGGSMDWYTFAADMARAIALVTVINVPLVVLLILLARRKKA